MKVLFISLGCDKNLVDSEYMIGNLVSNRYEITDEESEADVIVINTCCFIHDAMDESVQTIREMSRYRSDGPCRALIVCGCLAQRFRDEIFDMFPEVDAVLGTNSTEYIIDAADRALSGETYKLFLPTDRLEKHAAGRCISTGGHYAFLKIAEGCGKHCTYCIIPTIRGPYRSEPMDELVAEAEVLASRGVRELILVAQETTLYGADLYGEKSLHKLLRRLNDIEDLKWIRILYCYPEEIYPELIEAIRDCEKVCHYIDLPIQHCNDQILKKMGRWTDKESIKRQISSLREAIPDIAIRTSVICGFPGETDRMHEELLEFIDETEFDRLGAFTYSREDGTPASVFPDQIDEDTKMLWQTEVMELEREVIMDKNDELIGSVVTVMVEGKIVDEDAYIGRSYRDAPDVDGYVFIETDQTLISGDMLDVRITGAYEYDLIGEPVAT